MDEAQPLFVASECESGLRHQLVLKLTNGNPDIVADALTEIVDAMENTTDSNKVVEQLKCTSAAVNACSVVAGELTDESFREYRPLVSAMLEFCKNEDGSAVITSAAVVTTDKKHVETSPVKVTGYGARLFSEMGSTKYGIGSFGLYNTGDPFCTHISLTAKGTPGGFYNIGSALRELNEAFAKKAPVGCTAVVSLPINKNVCAKNDFNAML